MSEFKRNQLLRSPARMRKKTKTGLLRVAAWENMWRGSEGDLGARQLQGRESGREGMYVMSLVHHKIEEEGTGSWVTQQAKVNYYQVIDYKPRHGGAVARVVSLQLQARW